MTISHGASTLAASKLDDSRERMKFAHGPGGGGALYAEAPVGDPRGYETLDAAIAAVAPLSTDEGGNPSSVVFRGDDGRFHAREVTSRHGLGRHEPYHAGTKFDYTSTPNYEVDEQIAAIVDVGRVDRSVRDVVGGNGVPGPVPDDVDSLAVGDGHQPGLDVRFGRQVGVSLQRGQKGL